jgi:hypothetical protein
LDITQLALERKPPSPFRREIRGELLDGNTQALASYLDGFLVSFHFLALTCGADRSLRRF